MVILEAFLVTAFVCVTEWLVYELVGTLVHDCEDAPLIVGFTNALAISGLLIYIMAGAV